MLKLTDLHVHMSVLRPGIYYVFQTDYISMNTVGLNNILSLMG